MSFGWGYNPDVASPLAWGKGQLSDCASLVAVNMGSSM